MRDRQVSLKRPPYRHQSDAPQLTYVQGCFQAIRHETLKRKVNGRPVMTRREMRSVGLPWPDIVGRSNVHSVFFTIPTDGDANYRKARGIKCIG